MYNKILGVLILSFISVQGSDVGIVQVRSLKKAHAFCIPQYYSQDSLPQITEDEQNNPYSVNLGQQRQAIASTTINYGNYAQGFMQNHPINQSTYEDDDGHDSLKSLETEEPVPYVTTTESQSQTDPIGIHTRHIGIQVSLQDRTNKIVTRTVYKEVHKEQKLSFCELITKLCCCEWD